MGKALMGSHATPRTIALLDEVRSLRARVAELERALEAAESARDARFTEVVKIDEPAGASR